MSSTNTPRSGRRTVHAVAVGAVALTAAVALPAFAIDRGGDDEAVDVQPAAATAESTTTTTSLDPQVVAWIEATATDQWLKALEAMTPEQRFEIQTKDWTQEQKDDFGRWVTYQQELSDFFARAAWIKGVNDAREAAARQDAAQARAASRSTSSGSSGSGAVSGSVWDRLAQCETGGNWSHPTVSGGFSGGLMFHYATWNANGGQAYAATASGATRAQQIEIAERVLAQSGWGAWPGCSAKLGLR